MRLRALKVDGAQMDRGLLVSELESKVGLAFCLNDMTLTADGVRVGYLDHEGKPLRMDFRFSPSGKILHTSCARCCTA